MRGVQIEHRAAGPALLDGGRGAGEIARQHLVARGTKRVRTAPKRWMIERARHVKFEPLAARFARDRRCANVNYSLRQRRFYVTCS